MLLSILTLSASLFALNAPAHAISEADADDADARASAAASDGSDSERVMIDRSDERFHQVQATSLSITSPSGDKRNQQGSTHRSSPSARGLSWTRYNGRLTVLVDPSDKG